MAKTLIFNSYKEFYNRPDKSINGVSIDFTLQYPNCKRDNETNIGCYDCADCINCSNCNFVILVMIVMT